MWKLEIDFSYNYCVINFLLVIILCWFGKTKNLLVTHFFQVIIVGIFLPITVITNHLGKNIEVCFIAFFSILLSMGLYSVSKILLAKNITLQISTTSSFTHRKFRNLTFIFSACLVSFILLTNSSSLQSLNIIYTFINVYDIRSENTLPGFAAYLIGWFISFFMPCLVATYFDTKKGLHFCIAFVGVYIVFQLFAMKSHFFTFLLLLFFGYLYKSFPKIREYAVMLFFSIITLITLLFGGLMYAFFDRFFYLPGLLNVCYFDFFNTHHNNYFQGSKLGIFFNEKGYSEPIGFVIDNYFFGGGMNANTGYIASSFAELGFAGLLIATMLISFLLFFVTLLSSKNQLFGYLIGIGFSFLLINAPITDVFLSNGAFLVIIFSLILEMDKVSHRQIKVLGR